MFGLATKVLVKTSRSRIKNRLNALHGHQDHVTVSWCFKPSQPQTIISGLRETFVKEIVERTNIAEIRPEEQSEKVERCRKNLWNEIQSKKP